MQTRADYELAIGVVREVIHKWDPYSLIAMGAPDDEFDPEIARVVTYISRIKTEQDAADCVSKVFSQQFGLEGFSSSECEEVGSKLFDALVNAGLVVRAS